MGRKRKVETGISSTAAKEAEHVVKHVKHVKTEMGKAQQVNNLPTPTEIKNMEQEGPQIQQLNSVQAVNMLAEKTTQKPNDGVYTELRYKTLYVDSKKKVEELKEDSIELVRRLESANAKIEEYEKKLIASGAPEEEVSVSILPKATAEATMKPSPPTEDGVPGADKDHDKYSQTEDVAPGADNDQKKYSKGKGKNPKSNPEATDGQATYPPKLRKSFRKQNGKS